MNESISQKIIKEIKHQNLKPVSKFRVWFRNFLPWLLFAFVVLLGGLSSSLLLHIFSVQDWDVYRRLDHSAFYIYVRTIPYLWLILAVVFFVVMYFDYRRTKYGYKMNFFILLVILVMCTGLTGVFMDRAGLGDKLEKVIEDKVPSYDYLSGRGLWNDMESGLLSGKIISREKNILNILTSAGEEYKVMLDEQTLVNADLQTGAKIKIIGELSDDKIFQAKEIRSWCGCNMCAKQKTCGIEKSCCGM